MAGADLFAFASQTETQGLVLAEALAVGLPVVALAGPGVEDSVRDGVDGVVVRPPTTGRRRAQPGRRDRDAGRGPGASGGHGRRRRARARSASTSTRRIDEVVALYREVLGHSG